MYNVYTGLKVNNRGQNFANNRILKNKAASNLHCQICSKKQLFKKIFQNFADQRNSAKIYWLKVEISWTCSIDNGTFKNNGNTSCVARFVLES